MTYIRKPVARHPKLAQNSLGLTVRDYEGKLSTLCAGCGHDSVTAAIVRAFWQLEIEPYKVVKLSGIGCSSKTPSCLNTASSSGILSPSWPCRSIELPTSPTAASPVSLVGKNSQSFCLSLRNSTFQHIIDED